METTAEIPTPAMGIPYIPPVQLGAVVPIYLPNPLTDLMVAGPAEIPMLRVMMLM